MVNLIFSTNFSIIFNFQINALKTQSFQLAHQTHPFRSFDYLDYLYLDLLDPNINEIQKIASIQKILEKFTISGH